MTEASEGSPRPAGPQGTPASGTQRELAPQPPHEPVPRTQRVSAVGRQLAGIAPAALGVGWAFLVHQGAGPDLAGEGSSWLAPRGFLHGPLADFGHPLTAAAAVTVPAICLAVAALFASRSSLARTLALSAAVATGCFAFYGLTFNLPWRFFAWRWSGTMSVFALIAGGAGSAVWLTRSWRHHGWPLRVALYFPVFAGLIAFERSVTGTNQSLPFGMSPWPAAQVLGLETVATGIAFVLLGVSEGLWSFSRLPRTAGRYGAIAVGLAVAVAFPSIALGVSAGQGLLPFRAGPQALWLLALATLATLVFASLRLWGQPAGLSQRSRLFGLSALLLGTPLILGQTLTRWDYAVTRNDRAQQVIDALAEHYQAEEIYPDALEELVASRRLASVPVPRIGFAPFSDGDFVYQNFGTSYLLEFSAPRWIQCTYNPPYSDEEEFEEEDGEEPLGGAWSCPSNPPELW